jgi:hypothetical protein
MSFARITGARTIRSWLLALGVTAMAVPAAMAQQPQRPNILVIMADDIGYWNISAYNRGTMGYHTPNIDRIDSEGAIFTAYDGQQSKVRDSDGKPLIFAAAQSSKQKQVNACRARHRDCVKLNQIPSFECQYIYQDCMNHIY